jgi:hypothetical protein
MAKIPRSNRGYTQDPETDRLVRALTAHCHMMGFTVQDGSVIRQASAMKYETGADGKIAVRLQPGAAEHKWSLHLWVPVVKGAFVYVELPAEGPGLLITSSAGEDTPDHEVRTLAEAVAVIDEMLELRCRR